MKMQWIWGAWILFVLMAFFPGNPAAAEVSEEWVKRLDGPGKEGALAAIVTDAEGNIVVAGYGGGSLVVKYRSDGAKLWSRTTGADGGWSPTAVAVDRDGNVVVMGTKSVSNGTGSYYRLFGTVKYGSDGSELWSREWARPVELDGGGYNDPKALAIDENGNIFITGSSAGTAPGDSDYATVKYSPDGALQWARFYEGYIPQLGSSALAIAVDSQGDVIVTGYSKGSGYQNEFATVKYSTSGELLWEERYGRGFGDQAWAVAVDGSDNVIVTGRSHNDSFYKNRSFLTLKYTPDGRLTWGQLYSGPGHGYNEPRDVAVDMDGNIVVTGFCRDGNGSYIDISDYTTIKYAPDGTELWVQKFGGTDDDDALAVDVDALGNIVVTGYTDTFRNSTPKNITTILYHPDGTRGWIKEQGGQPVSAIFDNAGNVIIAGVAREVHGLGEQPDIVKVAGDGTELWAKTNFYQPGKSPDHVSGMVLDSAGNIVVTGWGEDYWRDREVFQTIKLAPESFELWSRQYSLWYGDCNANAVAVDNADNVIVTGDIWYNSYYHDDMVTVKYDPDGALQWEKPTDHTSNWLNYTDKGVSIITDESGNSIVLRRWQSSYGIFKYGPDGSFLWKNWFNSNFLGSDYGEVIDLSTDAENNIIVAGSILITESSRYDYDYAIVKYEQNGGVLWAKHYDISDNEHEKASALAVDADGNVIVTGISFNNGYQTIKCDKNGLLQWVRTYEQDYPKESEIVTDLHGNVFVTASSFNTTTLWDFVTVKYAPTGKELWVKHYNGPADHVEEPCAIATDELGNVVVTGTSYNGTDYDYATVKYAPDGTVLWAAHYDNGNDDEPVSVKIDESGDVIVAGNSYDVESDLDIVIIKYSDRPKYVFNGFLPPLQHGGLYKCGRIVPIKFKLHDSDGIIITDAVASIEIYQISNNEVSGNALDLSSKAQEGYGVDYHGVICRVDEEQYIYNLDTSNLGQGDFRVFLNLDDGSQYYIDVSLK